MTKKKSTSKRIMSSNHVQSRTARRAVCRYFCLLLFIPFSLSCGATRVSTTERTAVELALIREAARTSIERIDVSAFTGKSFTINDKYLGNGYRDETAASVDRLYFTAALAAHLARAGLRLANRSEDADLEFYPLFDYAGIDDGEFLLGVPSFALPLPGMEASFPELALLKRHAQYGRVRFSLFGIDPKSGALLLDSRSEPKETIYARWTALIFFGWRATNLGPPF